MGVSLSILQLVKVGGSEENISIQLGVTNWGNYTVCCCDVLDTTESYYYNSVGVKNFFYVFQDCRYNEYMVMDEKTQKF